MGGVLGRFFILVSTYLVFLVAFFNLHQPMLNGRKKHVPPVSTDFYSLTSVYMMNETDHCPDLHISVVLCLCTYSCVSGN